MGEGAYGKSHAFPSFYCEPKTSSKDVLIKNKQQTKNKFRIEAILVIMQSRRNNNEPTFPAGSLAHPWARSSGLLSWVISHEFGTESSSVPCPWP